MKLSLVFIAAMFALITPGCAPTGSDFSSKNYEIGKVMEATVGSEMTWDESGKRNDVTRIVSEGWRTELIYGGVANDVVKINYREYNLGASGGAYARQAFYQELQYDLKQSQIITFKRMRLEIISAANDKIRYRVLEGLGFQDDASKVTEEVGKNEPISFYPMEKRRFVRVEVVKGGIFECYLIGENLFKYFFSDTKEGTGTPSSLPKTSVAKLQEMKN